eukprot:Skav221859  [mRNA]  locus=scaffold1175:374498:380999:- [translate_table: standard]
MHYAKTHSRAVQRDRHKDALARLRRLRHVHVSLDVKSQIAHTAASIKALHATETYYVGQHWYKDLRSSIAQALVPDRPHANPHLTCMLASSRLIDPELFAILQGIKLARKVLHNKAPHEKEKFFSMVSKHDLNPKQVWGPAGALTINLQKVGWQMKRQGFIETDTMIEVHLMDSCYFHIAALLTQAWMRHLSQAVLYRKQWPQLPPIDRAATLRVLRKLDDAQRAIVIQDIAGTHYTTEQKEHAQVEETTCIYCHQPEDYHHRTLACPATEHIRDQHASVFAYFQEYEHHQARLPVVFQDPLQDFYDLYFQRRPPPEWNMDTMQSVLEHLQAGKEIHIWTDASCSQPHEPLLRRSAFAVVTNLSDFTSEAQEHALQYFVTTKTIPSTFVTLGVGETQGKQTIDRGELQAVLAILDFFAEEIFPGRLVVHTDSAYVIQIAQKLLRCPQPSFAHGFKNYDHLRQLWVILRNGQFTLQKIKAHVAETNPHDLTFWHVGNEAADFAAKQFLQQQSRVNPLTPVLDPTTIALQLHAWFLYLCDLQTCRAQLKASAPEQPAVVTKQTWQERKQALLQWTPATPWVFLPPAEDHPGFLHTLWGTGITRAIVTWLSTIQWEHQPTADDRRHGSQNNCHWKPKPLAENADTPQASTTALIPAPVDIEHKPATGSGSHIDTLLQRIEEAATKGCIVLVKELLGQVSRCCSLLEAKSLRPPAPEGLGNGGKGGLQYRPEFMLWSLKVCLPPQLVEHLMRKGLQCPSRQCLQRSRVELDCATMIYSKRFILNMEGSWWIHLRADSSPQGGRDYFVSEFDWCKFSLGGSASLGADSDHISSLLEHGKVKLASRKALASVFKVICPQFVEHRWQYLYECVEWVLPRKNALQYLKLNDIVEGSQRGDTGGDNEKFQLSSRHLELLANLSSNNEQSLRFWATAGLAGVLASWGHSVSKALHSCPCHQRDPKRTTRKKRGRHVFEDVMTREETSVCPMAGRIGVMLASGYIEHSLQALKQVGIPDHTQAVLDDLDAGNRQSLLGSFLTAKSRLTYRMKQSFGYWTQLPWALLMIMRPFVETFTNAEEALEFEFKQ